MFLITLAVRLTLFVVFLTLNWHAHKMNQALVETLSGNEKEKESSMRLKMKINE